MNANVSISVTPGIGDVVVRPLRATALHESLRVVDEVLEPAIVEVRCGEHQ